MMYYNYANPPNPPKRPQYPRVTPKAPPSLNESLARLFAHCVKSKQNSSQKSIARHDISNCNNLCFCEKKISSNRSASRALSLKRTVTKIKQKRKKKTNASRSFENSDKNHYNNKTKKTLDENAKLLVIYHSCFFAEICQFARSLKTFVIMTKHYCKLTL